MAALYLGQVFDVLKLVTNKERKGYVKDSQIITALRIGAWTYFERQLLKYRVGGVLQGTYSAAQVGFEIPSTLRPFKKTASVVIAAGVGALPSDFIKEVSFTFPSGTAPNGGEFLTITEFNDRLASILLAPTVNDPIGKIEGSTVIVAPVGSTPINLNYIRRPIDFVYATTTDADGHGTTYNAATSTDMEFSQECYPDIIKEAMIILGVKTQDQPLMQLGGSAKE